MSTRLPRVDANPTSPYDDITQSERVEALKELGYDLEEIREIVGMPVMDYWRRRTREVQSHVITRDEFMELLKQPEFITLDKVGPMYEIQEGQAGVLDGKRIIVDEWKQQMVRLGAFSGL